PDEKQAFFLPGDDFHRLFVERSEARCLLTNTHELSIELEKGRVRLFCAQLEIQLRALKSRLVLGVGRLLGRFELFASSFPHRVDQPGIAVADEVRKRRALAVFLAHEKKRNVRRQQYSPGGELGRFEAREMDQALAAHPIADLIVVLREDDEAFSRNVARGATVAPLAERREFAGIDKALAKGLCHLIEPAVVLV